MCRYLRRAAGRAFPDLTTAKQIIPADQAADDKEYGKNGLGNKKEHSHAEAEAEQHKPA